MAEGCCQRGRPVLAASARRSHVPSARAHQLKVHRGTGHYLLCLQHWVALDWCWQWRHGKSVQFAAVWSALLSLPRPPTTLWPGTPEGLVPGLRTARGLAAVAGMPPRRPTPPPTPTPPIQWRPLALPRASGRQWGCCMR